MVWIVVVSLVGIGMCFVANNAWIEVDELSRNCMPTNLCLRRAQSWLGKCVVMLVLLLVIDLLMIANWMDEHDKQPGQEIVSVERR